MKKYYTLLLGLAILFLASWQVIHAQLPDTTYAAAHAAVHAEHAGSGHGDPYAPVFEIIFGIIVSAVVGRWLARLLRQPPVLGELGIGIGLGAVLYALDVDLMYMLRYKADFDQILHLVMNQNLNWTEAINLHLNGSDLSPHTIHKIQEILLSANFTQYYLVIQSLMLFSSLGVLLLLFMVGLESSVEEMTHVGGSALIVAFLGVVLPFGLGYATAWLVLPEGTSVNTLLFMGSTLCATSIGITARVFRDLRQLHLPEAKIVLGAAVVDDILGLIILAVVSGVVTTGGIEATTIGMIVLKSVLFLGAVVFFGLKLLQPNIRLFSKLEKTNLRLIYPFALLVVLAFLADKIGLASIVGAFAAGLIIKEEFFVDETPDDLYDGPNESVQRIIAPIEGIFAPVFFVIMGLQVDVTAFANPSVLLGALALSAVAVLGKVLAGITIRGKDRLLIGIGMIPRGEVGLIFAGVGRELGVLGGDLFATIIILVLITTVITPPLLAWQLKKQPLLDDNGATTSDSIDTEKSPA